MQSNKKIYIGYHTRLLIYAILFVFTFAVAVLFLSLSIDYKKEKRVDYTEKSNLDYKVYLKQNEFYETPYLDKNMLYIASLIDKVKIDFDYNFSITENSSIDFTYGIYGKLIIADESGNNSYFEKEYNLLEDKQVKLIDGRSKTIKDTISIDYDYYNSLANNFKMSYAVATDSYLKVYLKINKKGETIKLDDSDELSITIPLSEKSLNIKMDYKDINESNNLLSESSVMIQDKVLFIAAIVCIVILVAISVRVIYLLSLLKRKESKFDKYIKKILNEYDRLIAETSTCPDLTKNNIIKIKKFEELLDIRDNLKLPIMYYTLVKHQKAYFYIKHNEDLYLYVVKEVDLEK